MTGNRAFLTNIKPYNNSFVTFGDGVKAKIQGKGLLKQSGSSCLKEALLVEDLTANFISISQLCDLDLSVKFEKEGCVVLDKQKEVLMQGTRSSDNCYLWSPNVTTDVATSKCPFTQS